MTSAGSRAVLYVIACGAPPAAQLPDFVGSAQAQGWDVCVVVTPDGAKFADVGHLARLTGHPVRIHYKHPDEPDVLPPAAAFVVAPATFNTVNKLAHGISDTLALGLVNEAVGSGVPVSVTALREWGIRVILNPAGLPHASGKPAVFPWEELRAGLAGFVPAADRPAGR